MLVRCQGCAACFSGATPTAEALRAHYGLYDRDQSVAALTLTRYDQLIEGLEKYRHDARWLDVGCGSGHLLERVRAHGWHANGTEFGDAALAACRQKGLEVYSAEDAADELSPGSFDVISMIEVIEHLAEPRADLETAHRLLRPGGVLYVTTPNFGSLTRLLIGPRWRVVEYPEHLSYFTTTSLRRIARRAGFVPESVSTVNLSPLLILQTMRRRPPQPDAADPDDATRDLIARSGSSRRVVRWINRGVSATRLGDTIKALFVKPPA
jgi:2-polyprenyl-3-methyl-5-hydroxy-6-metoxy-1,4-benzoquinol methylase